MWARGKRRKGWIHWVMPCHCSQGIAASESPTNDPVRGFAGARSTECWVRLLASTPPGSLEILIEILILWAWSDAWESDFSNPQVALMQDPNVSFPERKFSVFHTRGCWQPVLRHLSACPHLCTRSILFSLHVKALSLKNSIYCHYLAQRG